MAHNAGESRLRTYPMIPAVTAGFIANVGERVSAWSSVPTAAEGCLVGGGGVVVPPGSPHDVATAVETALSYVGVRSGWARLCDRLACRAYGYVGSGYYSAAAHWSAMVEEGLAHPGDGCPPLGSFVLFDTGRIFGHVSIVVKTSPTCDWSQTFVTSNATYDHLTGYDGGAYLTTVAHLDAGYARARSGYFGWAEPRCRGARLPAGTSHPAPSGW